MRRTPVLRSNVHCRSLSSIHILYNHALVGGLSDRFDPATRIANVSLKVVRHSARGPGTRARLRGDMVLWWVWKVELSPPLRHHTILRNTSQRWSEPPENTPRHVFYPLYLDHNPIAHVRRHARGLTRVGRPRCRRRQPPHAHGTPLIATQ